MKRLWRDGNSAGRIAQELGVTRNAAMGKLHRLGLLRWRPSFEKPLFSFHRVARKRPVVSRGGLAVCEAEAARRAAIAAVTREREAVQSGPDLDIPETERRSFADLEPGDCRWAYGDGPFTFCNRLQEGTDSRSRSGVTRYCKFHHNRAYVQPVVTRSTLRAVERTVRAGPQTPRIDSQFDETETA